jgi:flagellar FliL protein
MVIVADENDVVEEVAKEEASVSGAKNPLLTILVLLNTIMMGAIAYFQFTAHEKISKQPNIQDIVQAEMKKGIESEASGTGEAKVEEGILFPLEGFTANLAQGDGPRRFIRLSTVLKFSKDSSEDEFKRRKAQIRDTVITTLNSKRPEDLLSVQGKSYLKEEIKAAINSFLVDGHVIDMFYVNFQVN